MEGVPAALSCIVCPEEAVDMKGENCGTCGELVSCIRIAWLNGGHPAVADDVASLRGGRRGRDGDVELLLGELESFRTPKKSKGKARPLSQSIAPLEGEACPKLETSGCRGVILASWCLNSDHMYLRCSNNDPQRQENKTDALCTWSFNSVREADPGFAKALLQRRAQENGIPK
jgi:hypothetical protein